MRWKPLFVDLTQFNESPLLTRSVQNGRIRTLSKIVVKRVV